MIIASPILRNKRIFLFFLVITAMILIRIPLLPREGLSYDMGYWFGWAKSIKDFGLTNIYEKFYTDYVNYPPMFMYFLFFLGKIYSAFGGSWQTSTPLFHILVKIPGLIFDIVAPIVIYLIGRKSFQLDFKKSFMFFLFYAFNPINIYDSAFWGQIDVIHSILMVIMIFLLSKKEFSKLWILFGVSITLKFQVIAILPLIGIVTLQSVGIKNTVKYIIYSILAFVFSSSVFIVAGKFLVLIKMYAALYSRNGWTWEFNAYNFWWLIGKNKLDGGIITVENLKYPVSLIFLIYIVSLMMFNLKRLKSEMLYFFAAMLNYAFFMIPIGVHDRYLYPFFPFFLIFSMKEKKFLKHYVILSIMTLFNMIQTLRPFIAQHFFEKLTEPPVFGNFFAVGFIVYFVYFSFIAFKKSKIPSKDDLKQLLKI